MTTAASAYDGAENLTDTGRIARFKRVAPTVNTYDNDLWLCVAPPLALNLMLTSFGWEKERKCVLLQSATTVEKVSGTELRLVIC